MQRELDTESPRVPWRLRGLSTGVFGLYVKSLIITILSLGVRDIPERFEKSLVVEPSHPFESGEFK